MSTEDEIDMCVRNVCMASGVNWPGGPAYCGTISGKSNGNEMDHVETLINSGIPGL